MSLVLLISSRSQTRLEGIGMSVWRFLCGFQELLGAKGAAITKPARGSVWMRLEAVV